MAYEWKQYRISAIKRRTGERIDGLTSWDGLASLFAVTPDGGGETKYVSELDEYRMTEDKCWCGELPTYKVPVDITVTNPNTFMSDGEPGLLVCEAHVDRDGFEPIKRFNEAACDCGTPAGYHTSDCEGHR